MNIGGEFVQLMQNGGPLMWVLLMAAIVGLSFAVRGLARFLKRQRGN